MTAFICLFLPAVLSVWVYEALCKKSLSKKHWLYLYTTDVLLINLVCFLVKKLILHTDGAPMYTYYIDMTPSIAANYLIMAIPFALILAVAERFCAKFIHITVEEPDDAEKSKN